MHGVYCVDPRLQETVVLKLPNWDEDWKELSRCVTKNKWMVERIPVNQTKENWMELICLQYFDTSKRNGKSNHSIENILNGIRKEIFKFPQKIATWKVLEKNKTDTIYEWSLQEPYNNIPPQHEISRAFLTEKGFYRIGFTRKNREMTQGEKEKWMKLLCEHTAVVCFEEAIHHPEWLSFADQIGDSIDVGIAFQDWEIVQTLFDNGSMRISRVPPSHYNVNDIKEESLEISSIPNVNYASIDQLFDTEKKIIQESAPKKIDFQILKKTPEEVIYTFSMPKDHLYYTAIIKSFVTNREYCSVTCKRKLAYSPDEKEVLEWMNKLESIKFHNASICGNH